MFKYLILIIVWNSAESAESRIKIAVFDDNISKETLKKKYMCERSAANDELSILMDDNTNNDPLSHGSNISSAIGENINPLKYCIVFFGVLKEKMWQYERNVRIASDEVVKQGIKFVNFSAGGPTFSSIEFFALKKIIDSGAVISVSAGNKRMNLDIKCNEFPACHATSLHSLNYHVVGSTSGDYTNTGNIITYWEDGTWGEMHGTSQANALSLARYIREIKEK